MLAIEDLDAAVAEFTHELKARIIDAHVVRVAEFIGFRARLAVGREPLAITPKDLDSMIARIGNVQSSLCIEGESFRTIKLTACGAVATNRRQPLCVATCKGLDAFAQTVLAHINVT